MILYGASGHAKVVLDICLKNGEVITMVLDDDIKKKDLLGYAVKHDVKDDVLVDQRMIISIGNNKVRKEISSKIKADYVNAIHPSAVVDPTVTFEKGTVVMANAVVNSHSQIGNHCILNTASSVDHDCNLEDFVHISPKATLCGGVSIGEGTQVGAGAIVLPNVKVGKWCKVGAGAVVLKDVEDYTTIVGNPGRILIK